MNFIYSISADGWISLLGSILSFLGVWLTIRYTKKQFKDDKRISIKPYLDIKLKCASDRVDSIGFFSINKLKNLNLPDITNLGIEITNLGQGHCLECKLIEIRINDKKINDELSYLGNIKTDENILKRITFKICYGDILEDIKKEYIDKKLEDCPKEFETGIYSYFLNQVEMEFKYKDVLDNKYIKNIVIDVFIIFNICFGGAPLFKVRGIEFSDVLYKINGNLITEEPIK